MSIGKSGCESSRNLSLTSLIVATPTSEFPRTKLRSRNDKGKPGTNVWIQTARRVSCTDSAFRSTPYMQRRAINRLISWVSSIVTVSERSPSSFKAALRRAESSLRTPPRLRSARKSARRFSMRSIAATRKWPEPIEISATRKSKNASAASVSSIASSRATWSSNADSRAPSSKCSTANCFV